MPRVSIVGVGRMGGALAIALAKAGYDIDHLIHRNAATAERISSVLPSTTSRSNSDALPKLSSDIILITTSDPEIEQASEQVEGSIEGQPVVLHTSGSLSSDVLANLARRGCPTGSMHPLVSISDPISGAASFSDVYFCIEGEPAAHAAAHEMVKALGGNPFTIPSDRKPLYHAAAVTAAGHVTALMDVAIEMLAKCGVDVTTSQRVLMPLIKSTVANLESQAPAEALTGTFARADAAALERHLIAMEAMTPETVREIYLLLGERSADLAEKNGVDAVKLRELRERISIAKRKLE